MSLFGKRTRKTEHEVVEEQLSAYLDDELTAQERGVVDRHLATCEDCQWNLDTLRQTVQWTAELPTIQVPRVFTIPVPAQPTRAPRWRWSLPVLQGATALAALLLVFAIAGDFMLSAVMPGAVPSRLMLEEPAADDQMTRDMAETVVEQIVAEKEAAPAVEAPVEAEKVVEASAPPPAPVVTEPTVVVEEKVEVVVTATDENSAMGVVGFESPPPGAQDVVSETEGAGEARVAAPEATLTEAAYAASGAQATSTTLPTIAPTPTSAPTAPPVPSPTLAKPTVLAEAPPDAVVAVPKDEAVETWQEPVAAGLDVAKIVLAMIFFLLVMTSAVVMVRRRRES